MASSPAIRRARSMRGTATTRLDAYERSVAPNVSLASGAQPAGLQKTGRPRGGASAARDVNAEWITSRSANTRRGRVVFPPARRRSPRGPSSSRSTGSAARPRSRSRTRPPASRVCPRAAEGGDPPCSRRSNLPRSRNATRRAARRGWRHHPALTQFARLQHLLTTARGSRIDAARRVGVSLGAWPRSSSCRSSRGSRSASTPRGSLTAQQDGVSASGIQHSRTPRRSMRSSKGADEFTDATW